MILALNTSKVFIGLFLLYRARDFTTTCLLLGLRLPPAFLLYFWLCP